MVVVLVSAVAAVAVQVAAVAAMEEVGNPSRR